jgi:osmotically-inducible protein OsmY
LFACLLLLLFGCDSQDADRLAHAGRRLASKLEAATGGADPKALAGWVAMRADLDQLTLDVRVGARLRWDKALAGSQIQTTVNGTTVELKGKVKDLEQRRRAVELAESTAGVEKVTDSLEVPQREP